MTSPTVTSLVDRRREIMQEPEFPPIKRANTALHDMSTCAEQKDEQTRTTTKHRHENGR